MKNCLVIPLFPLLSFYAAAQEPAPPAQELEPVRNAFTHHTPEYSLRIRKLLFDSMDDQNEFQFLSMPAFQPETLLSVRKSGATYTAQVVRAETSIWYYKGDDEKLKVNIVTKTLPPKLALRAEALWEGMLLRTRFQRRQLVLDGISYVFLGFAGDYGFLTAQSANPEAGTKPAILGHIGQLLIQYVEAKPEQEQKILNSLQEHMSDLEQKLKN